ncbi:tryptophan synthase subunit alpha [Dokdonella immobilis]|uniref:Tryptophan synthase alpha chain n=1 Tax=Dokdonella immobilis TaxID=578942 RepID=A0A1I5A4X8_9GAMM|nr:tryptophan synthase subunit alpha [Dokdonella immobilis]SFN57535.1 tryptophan synthase, alpha chain [Dokdonella immobilis]
MSERIEQRFADLRKRGRKGLVPFMTAGDPLPEATVAIMRALADAGADLIELGMPYSDPVADGPTIQHSSERAIARGVGIERILGWVAEFRETDATTPIVLMGYLNPIEIYGYARFAEQARAAGVDGVLIVDVPVEESASIEPLREAGIRQIFLVAPTTTEVRLAAIRRQARGFVYYVSFAGITGASQLDPADVRRRVDHIKQGGDIPVAVGFGVRDAATAVTISESADAVVIGSALVASLAEASDAESAVSAARDFLVPIRKALDAAAAA